MCGNLNLLRDHPSEEQILARLAFLTGIRGWRVPPMRPIPLVTGPTTCLITRWGWPMPSGEPLMHCRIETAATLPTWREAFAQRRGVIPVSGWHEGDRSVDAPGAHLAVLWTNAPQGEVRCAVVTQEPPKTSQVPRYPIPLTQAGSLEWLSGGGIDQQVPVMREYGQESIFA
jgi:putative SOS response-associated peptidase YedK